MKCRIMIASRPTCTAPDDDDEPDDDDGEHGDDDDEHDDDDYDDRLSFRFRSHMKKVCTD